MVRDTRIDAVGYHCVAACSHFFKLHGSNPLVLVACSAKCKSKLNAPRGSTIVAFANLFRESGVLVFVRAEENKKVLHSKVTLLYLNGMKFFCSGDLWTVAGYCRYNWWASYFIHKKYNDSQDNSCDYEASDLSQVYSFSRFWHLKFSTWILHYGDVCFCTSVFKQNKSPFNVLTSLCKHKFCFIDFTCHRLEFLEIVKSFYRKITNIYKNRNLTLNYSPLVWWDESELFLLL